MFKCLNWVKKLRAQGFGAKQGRSKGRRRPARGAGHLRVEGLEDRTGPAVLTVNSLADNTVAGDGLVTLREAILAANNDGTTDLGHTGSGADTIGFAPSLFSGGAGTINLSVVGDTAFGPSALAITSTITITGPTGSNGLTIARSAGVANLRLFYVSSCGNLTLQYLTLKDGRHQGGSGGTGHGDGGGAAGLGGAIYNQGSLTIENSTLTGNQAVGGNGGDDGLSFGGGGGGGGLNSAGNDNSGLAGGNGGGPNGGSGGALGI